MQTRALLSGVTRDLYDVLISTHIAQDFAAYADPLTSALVYRPHLLKGDLRTLASIPLSPTSRRSWTHTQAQTHFVCCTTHVVSNEGRGVSGDGVVEEFSDCSEYFEVTRMKKRKWNRAAAALKMSCKSSSQVDSHVPPHQPSTNKRKGKRVIRPGLNMMHKFTNEDSAQAQINHLGWSNAFSLFALMCTIGEVVRINPKPLPQTGRTSPLVVLEGTWSRATCLTTVNSTLPDGTASDVMSDNMCKDEELGAIWENHPQTSSSQRAAFWKAVSIQEEKCEELKKVGLIIPAPSNWQYARECVLPVKKDADGNYTDRRFCVDYREINSATEADKYGLHRPEHILGDIKGHGFFIKIDLRAGFHQIEVKKEDQPKTAFW